MSKEQIRAVLNAIRALQANGLHVAAEELWAAFPEIERPKTP